MDEHTISAAGDPFYAAALHGDDHLRHETPHGCPACFGGYVTITVEADGTERDEPMLCRKCSEASNS